MPNRIVFLLFVLLACSVSMSQEPSEKLKLFLLIGQSNMAGRGRVEAQDQVANPKIFMLDKDCKWVLAKDPLHFDKPGIAGVGLASQFAREILKADSETSIGLIPCAVGGTSLQQWKPGGKLYSEAVERARIALKDGMLAGILWHQGESDSGTPESVATYPERFAAMIANLRKDLNADGTPLLVGELGRYQTKYLEFNKMLPKAAALVQPCAIVSSEGLGPNADNIHLNSASLRIFGARYAEAFLSFKRPAK